MTCTSSSGVSVVNYGPGALDILTHQGDDWSLTVTFKDGDGNPIDLTGYVAAMEVRKGPRDLYPVLATAVSEINDPTTGVITASLSSAVTADLNGVYKYDLELSGDGLSTRTILAGVLTVTSEVTE